MTSKEELQNIRDYRIDIVKKLDIIEKDLEMLEILKEWLENGNDWICYNSRN